MTKYIGKRETNANKQIKQMVTAFDKIYLKSIQELEKYAEYILRCLHRAGIHPTPKDLGFATFERENGTISQAVFYPVTSAVDGVGVVNPAFFLGFKFEYDFRDLDKPFQVIFCDNPEDLKK